MLGKQFNGKMVFKQSDIGMAVDSVEQGSFNFPASKILRMHNPASGMTALFAEVQMVIVGGGEVDTKFCKALYMLWSLFDHDRNHLQVAKAGAGIKSVGNMEF